MVQHHSWGRRVFLGCNYLFLTLVAFLCLFPLVQVLAVSLSSSSAASAGLVKLWPVDFTLEAYRYVAHKAEFARSLLVTVKRVALGATVNVFLTILLAYPLSKEAKDFNWRTLYVWLFVFTMLFHGGMIPSYILIKEIGLLDSIWALILPTAVPIFNVVLLLNFFRGLPKELIESSFIDGANHWSALWRIVVPVSLPALATITLFSVVFHWNAWFDGIIYMNSTEKYPLQSYMQTIIVARDLTNLSADDLTDLKHISDRTVKAAQIFLGALPILCLYPFLQRYFMSGIVMGSVKG